MERRSNVKIKFLHFSAVLFCILLFVFLVGIADMSTRRMMMSKDDKYAIGLRLTEGNLLRIDAAGEKFFIDLGPAFNIKNSIAAESKRYFEEFKDFIESKLGR